MKTGTLPASTSRLRFVARLVLAGVFFSAYPALAQTQQTCPLPAGVTPPAPPRVTAQQVDDGSATLMDFALAVRDRNREVAGTSVEQAAYIGCLYRQEGSPYRSDPTYLVQLTPDGRVLVHAKDMALSGRLLDPSVYGAILLAVGINPADLADPATALAAFAAAATGNGGEFRVPNVPDASGYAFVYFSATVRTPLVMLAGFDLDESHVVREDVDYGDPTITARDVVDRETLKAFVTQAGEFILAQQQSGDPAAASRARIALRDPNGPWRHGPVYLYTLDLNSNIILFHGASPDRFELRPLVPTLRDVVTGEFILPQVIAAATSSPEGGFVDYYFDDPTDDTDSADIPKVGYAREFTGEIRRPDGSVLPINFVVGSGFYLSSPEVIAARQNASVEFVLPQVMRAMTASTVDAVSGRIEKAGSGSPPSMGFSLGGASTLSGALLAHGKAIENGTVDPGRLLAGSSFHLPLSSGDAGAGGMVGSLALWGSGDYRKFSGGNRQSVDYSGDVVSAHLGVDTRVSDGLLAGMSVALARGTVDYTDSYALTGEIESGLTSIHPYVGWQGPGGMSLWATAGYGWGDVEIDDQSADPEKSDLTQQMAAAGVNGTLMASDRVIEGGTTSLEVKAEAAFTRADIEGSGNIRESTLNAHRQRLIFEGVHARKLASGATFAPSIELGVRHDGGDGETGTGLELGGGLRFADPATGLTIQGRARTLLHHGGDYDEWGLSGLVRVDPGTSGRGLALSVRPAWGQTAGSVRQLWETSVTGGATPVNQAAAGRVSAEVGYGLGAGPGLGVVTPYAGLELAVEGARSWRMGTRWQVAPEAHLDLEGTRHESARDDRPEHGLMLRGALRW